MASGRDVAVPTTSGRFYTPATIRDLQPGHEIPVHCGDFFLGTSGYRDLSQLVAVDDQSVGSFRRPRRTSDVPIPGPTSFPRVVALYVTMDWKNAVKLHIAGRMVGKFIGEKQVEGVVQGDASTLFRCAGTGEDSGFIGRNTSQSIGATDKVATEGYEVCLALEGVNLQTHGISNHKTIALCGC